LTSLAGVDIILHHAQATAMTQHHIMHLFS